MHAHNILLLAPFAPENSTQVQGFQVLNHEFVCLLAGVFRQNDQAKASHRARLGLCNCPIGQGLHAIRCQRLCLQPGHNLLPCMHDSMPRLKTVHLPSRFFLLVLAVKDNTEPQPCGLLFYLLNHRMKTPEPEDEASSYHYDRFPEVTCQ